MNLKPETSVFCVGNVSDNQGCCSSLALISSNFSSFVVVPPGNNEICAWWNVFPTKERKTQHQQQQSILSICSGLVKIICNLLVFGIVSSASSLN
jgi:hypothetical protein